jgi:hypothetical protein
VPGLKIEDVFKRVRNEVIKASADRQIPWESSSLTSEFVFRPASAEEIESEKLKRAREDREELLKEMQNLKAELLAMRQQAALADGAPDVVGAVVSKPAEPSKVEVVAVTSPTAAAAAPVPASSEWSARIAAIEKVRRGLNLSKALALLLDITSDEDLLLLVSHESYIKQLPWPTSYALGVDANGYLIWGIGSNWRVDAFSVETALESCAKQPTDKCRLILHNGDFDVNDFIGLARLLSPQSVSSVKRDFLKNLVERPTEKTLIGGGTSGAMRQQKAVSSNREP